MRQAALNQQTLPARTRVSVKWALLRARAVLARDSGRLWGDPIWTAAHLLVLGRDEVIYSLVPLAGGTTTDSVGYTRQLLLTTPSQSNSVQSYEGQ